MKIASNRRRSRNDDGLSVLVMRELNVDGVPCKDYVTCILKLTLILTRTLQHGN